MAELPDGTAGFDSDEIRAGILAEINDLKATAQAFGWDALKTGSWFNQFLHACLSSYHERVMQQGGEAYLRSKYPGLPTEAVAGKLCEMAEQAAAIAGSLSGAAASGAVLTAGAGIPVAVAAVMGEVLFTIRLQLRLVYDIHLLYGIPLDAGDPEDLLGIFAIVYGVKLAEIGGVGAKTLGPEVIRAQLFRLIHGNTKIIQQAVSRVMGPRIARSVTQKAILKTAVPVVGVAISAGWNYTATKLMASRVRQEVRIKAGLREETLRLHERIRSDEQIALPVIEGLVALATADGEFSDFEREVYLAFLRQLELSEDQLKSLASKIHADIDGVLNALRSIAEDQSQEAIGRCFCLIAAANGDISDPERELLQQLLAALRETLGNPGDSGENGPGSQARIGLMSGKQLGFSDYELTTAKKQTKREKFLAEMEAVVPWQALIDLIEPHYRKASKKGGRPPYPLTTMLQIHLLLQWYSLSDPAMEEALIEVPTMRLFAGIALISDRIPDETTILSFRHLLEKYKLGELILESVKAHLSERGMTMRHCTIVDATLIAAPSSTKNKEGKLDPEKHQTKKGNQWYFGMKIHAGVDKDSELIHSVVVTAANVHDLTPAAGLLHGDEQVVYADAGFQGITKRPEMAGKTADFRVAMRPGERRVLPDTPE